MKKTCPRCGGTFECNHGNIAMCHCAAVKLSIDSLRYMKANFNECLCHKCLLEIKRQETATPDDESRISL